MTTETTCCQDCPGCGCCLCRGCDGGYDCNNCMCTPESSPNEPYNWEPSMAEPTKEQKLDALGRLASVLPEDEYRQRLADIYGFILRTQRMCQCGHHALDHWPEYKLRLWRLRRSLPCICCGCSGFQRVSDPVDNDRA